jgi:hypothetical protein
MNKNLFALLAGLALASSSAAGAAPSAQAWLETYYLDPQPVRVPAVFQTLSRDGYFDRPGNLPIAIGFFATVFAQNSASVDRWLLELTDLPLRHHRLLAAVLWQAGHPLGAELMHALGEHSPLRYEIQRLAQLEGRTVAETPVRSKSSMNLQWGAFLASGQESYLLNIFEAIGANESGLDLTAQAALAQHASDHPRVMEICRDQLARAPQELQPVLRAVVNSPIAPRPSG